MRGSHLCFIQALWGCGCRLTEGMLGEGPAGMLGDGPQGMLGEGPQGMLGDGPVQ